MPNLESDRIDLDSHPVIETSVYCCSPVFGGKNLEYFRYCLVLNCDIHKKVFIYVYLQFKSQFKDNYLALTPLKIPLINSYNFLCHMLEYVHVAECCN